MAYRLPFNKDELRYMMENETIFKRINQLGIDNFIKYLFPQKDKTINTPADRGASESSSGSNRSVETSPAASKTFRNTT